MKLAVIAPYGDYHRESGLIYLLANALTKRGGDVVQTRCDGALLACGRDQKHPGGKRTPFSCLHCISEQSALARWAEVRNRDLSTYLTPEDNAQSAQWVQTAKREELARLEFRGERVWDVCAQETSDRWALNSERDLTAEQERSVRALFLGYIHAVVSSERFIAAFKPSLSFIAGGTDPVTRAYLSQARRAEGDVALFSYREEDDSIVISNLKHNTQLTTTVVLSDITEMRSDYRTWAPELKAIVSEISSFLGYGEDLIPAR